MRTSNAAIGNESRWEKKEKKEGATKQFHKYTKSCHAIGDENENVLTPHYEPNKTFMKNASYLKHSQSANYKVHGDMKLWKAG